MASRETSIAPESESEAAVASPLVSQGDPVPSQENGEAGADGDGDGGDGGDGDGNGDGDADDAEDGEDDFDEAEAERSRRKQPITYIQNRTRRHVTFAKRRHGIMKKAYELSVLTGANILLLIQPQNTGLVYTFTTPRLESVITGEEGKSLVRRCLAQE